MKLALFDMLRVAVLGREEDAADQVSSFIILELGKEEARRLIGGVAHAFKTEAAAKASPTMTEFSGVHGACLRGLPDIDRQRYLAAVHRDHGTEALDFRVGEEQLARQGLVFGHVGDVDHQHEVDLRRDVKDLLHGRTGDEAASGRIQQVEPLALQRHGDDDRDGFADLGRINHRNVSLDDARGFQRRDAPVDGGCGQIDMRTDIALGHAAILLQQGQNLPVETVELHQRISQVGSQLAATTGTSQSCCINRPARVWIARQQPRVKASPMSVVPPPR